jgi:hypothetical protein
VDGFVDGKGVINRLSWKTGIIGAICYQIATKSPTNQRSGQMGCTYWVSPNLLLWLTEYLRTGHLDREILEVAGAGGVPAERDCGVSLRVDDDLTDCQNRFSKSLLEDENATLRIPAFRSILLRLIVPSETIPSMQVT